MTSNLILESKDIFGDWHTLPHPLEFMLIQSLDSPADGFSCSVCYEENLPELWELRLILDKKVLFIGIVDKQTLTLSANGAILELQARSMGALLLDNEALPLSFEQACIHDIFNIYVRPYQLFQLDYSASCHYYPYTVPKGISDWEAFSDFAKMSVGKYPHLDGNTLRLSAKPATHNLVFSNTDKGLPYLSAKKINDRYEVISSVGIRDEDGYYRTQVKNPEANYCHISRRRFLIPQSSYMTTPVHSADEKIKYSMQKKLTYQLILAGLSELALMDFMHIHDPIFEGNEALCIHELTFMMTAKGFFTKLKASQQVYL